MGAMTEPATPPSDRPAPARGASAAPSVGARVLALVVILVAGAAGGFIGYAFVDLQVTGDATLATGLGALIGAVIAAGGTAVVVVLTLRAMGEWKTIQERQGPVPPSKLPPDRRGGPPPRVR